MRGSIVFNCDYYFYLPLDISLTSLLSSLSNPIPARTKIRQKGRPILIVAVCNAFRPPKLNNTAATVPSVIAQKTFVRFVGFKLPELRISITREAESDEVMKKSTTDVVTRIFNTVANGNGSKKTKIAVEIFSLTAFAMLRPSFWIS